eukprot:ctg_1010.g329
MRIGNRERRNRRIEGRRRSGGLGRSNGDARNIEQPATKRPVRETGRTRAGRCSGRVFYRGSGRAAGDQGERLCPNWLPSAVLWPEKYVHRSPADCGLSGGSALVSSPGACHHFVAIDCTGHETGSRVWTFPAMVAAAGALVKRTLHVTEEVCRGHFGVLPAVAILDGFVECAQALWRQSQPEMKLLAERCGERAYHQRPSPTERRGAPRGTLQRTDWRWSLRKPPTADLAVPPTIRVVDAKFRVAVRPPCQLRLHAEWQPHAALCRARAVAFLDNTVAAEAVLQFTTGSEKSPTPDG